MGSLMGILSGLFTNQSRNEETVSDTGEAAGGGETFEKITKSIEFLIRPVGFTLAVLALILILIPLIKRMYMLSLVFLAIRKGDYSEALLIRYKAYAKKLVRLKAASMTNADPLSVAEEMISDFEEETDKEKVMSVAETVRKAAYSNEDISGTEYGSACADMKYLVRLLKKIKKRN